MPYDKSVPVAPLEPKVVLQLDVLTNHVHAEILHHLQVIDHSLVGWWRQESVRPPTLVEWTIHIQGLIVEQYCRVTIYHGSRELPHAEVSGHLVHLLSLLFSCDFKVIQIWFVGTPKLSRRDGQCESLVRGTSLLDNSVASILYGQRYRTRCGGLHLNRNV